MNKIDLWNRYNQYMCNCPKIGLSLDISRMKFDDGFLGRMEPDMQRAFKSMAASISLRISALGAKAGLRSQ